MLKALMKPLRRGTDEGFGTGEGVKWLST